MTERIMLVEDDIRLGLQVTRQLESAGFQCTWLQDGASLRTSDVMGLSLVVLDLMLPDASGLDLLKSIRANSDVPVLILSARNDTLDKVRALKLGADDYMTKPFWPDELIERVRARLRRPALQRRDELEARGLRIDNTTRQVWLDSKPVVLTRVEFDLLAALVHRPGASLTRAWLAEHCLDPDREGGERTLDVHISRLRAKLGGKRWIETVWGIGYRLALGDA